MYTHPNTPTLYIAIDVGKNVHCYGAYAGLVLKPVKAPQKVRTTRAGFTHFQKWVNQQFNHFQPMMIGMEPTGIYHDPWAYAIHDTWGDQVHLKCINPYQTKRKRDQLQKERDNKTDPVDVIALAYCLRDGVGRIFQPPDPQQDQFDLWMAEYRQLKKRRQRLLNHLSTQMDALWPGALVNVRQFQNIHPELETPTPLLLSRPFERQLLHVMLEHRPNPYDWIDQSLEEIQHFFRRHGRRCGPHTAQTVRNVVQQALFLPFSRAKMLSERLRADFLLYQQLDRRLDQLRDQVDDLVPGSQAEVLTTIPGINRFLAAQYMAHIGNPARFERASQVWALAGFDPGRYDSGDRRHTGSISRRGNAGFRSTLYQIGLNTSQRCAAIRRCKQRALRRGKNPVGANIHAAHKANRICFHLLSHQIPFDPVRAR